MTAVKKYPLIILANGRGTRMAILVPKTLIKLTPGQTILARLIKEACVAGSVSEIIVFVRQGSAALRHVLKSASLPTKIIIEEPTGYFHDLVAIKHALALKEFFVVDADLVMPTGEFTNFLAKAPCNEPWLTIGITSFPEQSSGRPAWVKIAANDRISFMDRQTPTPHRTVGVFYWGNTALRIDSQSVGPEASVMAYIAEHVKARQLVQGLPFSRTVNVNTKEDISTANSMITQQQ